MMAVEKKPIEGMIIVFISCMLLLLAVSFLSARVQLEQMIEVSNENYDIGAVCLERNALVGETIDVYEPTTYPSEDVVVIYAK